MLWQLADISALGLCPCACKRSAETSSLAGHGVKLQEKEQHGLHKHLVSRTNHVQASVHLVSRPSSCFQPRETIRHSRLATADGRRWRESQIVTNATSESTHRATSEVYDILYISTHAYETKTDIGNIMAHALNMNDLSPFSRLLQPSSGLGGPGSFAGQRGQRPAEFRRNAGFVGAPRGFHTGDLALHGLKQLRAHSARVIKQTGKQLSPRRRYKHK